MDGGRQPPPAKPMKMDGMGERWGRVLLSLVLGAMMAHDGAWRAMMS